MRIFEYSNESGDLMFGKAIVHITLFIVLLTIISSAISPVYGIWKKELRGKADLKEAEWNRQIKIKEAEATKESSKQLAEAEVIRAKGIAEANKIIANSITPEYLKYKFIEGLNDGSTEVIYVPTEANIPILEARSK